MPYFGLTFGKNLLDPATIYSYSMISLHHDIMWFIFVILSVVCWSLYRILEECFWTVNDKKSGIIKFTFVDVYLMYIETVVVYVCVKIALIVWVFFYYCLYIIYSFLLYFNIRVNANDIIYKFLDTCIGIDHGFSGLLYPVNFYNEFTFNGFLNLMKQRYFSFFLSVRWKIIGNFSSLTLQTF